jgi:hypothetical protein
VCEWEFDSLIAHERQRETISCEKTFRKDTRGIISKSGLTFLFIFSRRRCVKNLLKSLSSVGPSKMKGMLDEPATPNLCVAHANWLLINLSLMGVIIKTRPTCSQRSKIAQAQNFARRQRRRLLLFSPAFKRYARACWHRHAALKSVSLEPLLHLKRARWQQHQ